MRIWICLLMAPIVLPGDQITLKNGDKISGKILKKDGGKISLKSEFLGSVVIPWEAVTEVSSEEPLVAVLPGDKSVTGKLSTSGGRLEVVTETGREAAPLAEVSALRNADEQRAYERLQSPGLLQLWAGSADLGFSLARGNARTNVLTTALNAARVTRTDKTTLYFNQIYSTATINRLSSETAEAVRGGWAYSRDIGPRVFVNLFNDYEYDRFQNLDLRFVLGGGLGVSVVKNERSRLDLLGGLSYNREKFNAPLTRNSAEVFFGDDFTHKLSGASALKQSFRIFPNLSNSGEYRMTFDLAAVTAFNRWLAWQVTASDRFLSNPAPGRQRNDVLLTTGFRITFAR